MARVRERPTHVIPIGVLDTGQNMRLQLPNKNSLLLREYAFYSLEGYHVKRISKHVSRNVPFAQLGTHTFVTIVEECGLP